MFIESKPRICIIITNTLGDIVIDEIWSTYKRTLKKFLIISAIHTLGAVVGGVNMITMIEMTQGSINMQFKVGILLFGKSLNFTK